MEKSQATVTVCESHYTLDQGSSKSVPTIIPKGCTFLDARLLFLVWHVMSITTLLLLKFLMEFILAIYLRISAKTF